MAMRGGGGRAVKPAAPPRHPNEIRVRQWHLDDVRVAHFTIKRWVPVSQEHPTAELQQASRFTMTGGSKRKSAAWRESGQQGGRLTRKQKQELAAGGEFHEELIAGLEAVPILARDYQRTAAQQRSSFRQSNEKEGEEEEDDEEGEEEEEEDDEEDGEEGGEEDEEEQQGNEDQALEAGGEQQDQGDEEEAMDVGVSGDLLEDAAQMFLPDGGWQDFTQQPGGEGGAGNDDDPFPFIE